MVATVYKDLECLARATERCGGEFLRNQTTYKWVGRWFNDYSEADAAYLQGIDPKDYGKCLHAIRVKGNPNAFEIGVVKNPTGDGYRLIFDFIGHRGKPLLDMLGGQDAAEFDQQYRLAVIEQEVLGELTLQGYHLEQVRQENGDIQLVLEQ
jgi:hypothetical protein